MKRLPFLILLVVFTFPVAIQAVDYDAYLSKRTELERMDRSFRRSAAIILTPVEAAADSVLMALKEPLLALPTHKFFPAQPFHRVQGEYKSSPLFDVLRRFPKGALLHVHPTATGRFERLIELTYRENCWIFTGENGGDEEFEGCLSWNQKSPGEGWVRVLDDRSQYDSAKEYDRKLLELITLGAEDSTCAEPWREFERCFTRIWRLYRNENVFREVMTETCKDLVRENVQHVEFHAGLSRQLKENGKLGTTRETLENWRAIREATQAFDPNFDLKIIVAAGRWSTPENVSEYWNSALNLWEDYDDLLVGVDLVNEEDQTKTNLEYAEVLLGLRKKSEMLGHNVRFILHSGESNRLNNRNMIDIPLLDAYRVGHGFALIRHPEVLDLVKEKQIALEVNPLSNQVLGYFYDLRNHPAVSFLAMGVPMVISSDDPGMMGYSVTYDWLAATVAWDLSLADLKQLAMDSFAFSCLDDERRNELEAEWAKRWDEFVLWLSNTHIASTDNEDILEK